MRQCMPQCHWRPHPQFLKCAITLTTECFQSPTNITHCLTGKCKIRKKAKFEKSNQNMPFTYSISGIIVKYNCACKCTDGLNHLLVLFLIFPLIKHFPQKTQEVIFAEQESFPLSN